MKKSAINVIAAVPSHVDRGTLAERIQQLRERVGESAATPGQSLARRLGDLRERLRHHGAEGARWTLDAQRSQVENVPSVAPLRGVVTMTHRGQALAEQLSRLERTWSSHDFAAGPVLDSSANFQAEAARWSQLLDFILRSLHQVACSPNQEWNILDSLEMMTRELTRGMGTFIARWLHEQRQARWLADTRVVLVETCSQQRLTSDAQQTLERITQEILNEIDGSLYPRLCLHPATTVEDQLARHALNVAQVAAFLASSDPRARLEREPLVFTALLQDVGMLRVAPAALMAAEALDAEQRAEMEAHPLVGALVLEHAANCGSRCAQAAADHHERGDGSGYPRGLIGEQIYPWALLLAVADAYVGRRSPRAYRTPMDAKHALLDTLGAAQNGQLDRRWACRLCNLSLYRLGAMVELSTGEWAEVVASQEATEKLHWAAAPIVRVVRDRHGQAVYRDIYWNLAHRPDCRIVREVTDSPDRE